MELFRPDTPIKAKSEDKFQRYEFAARVADIVSKGKHPQSLVVGIYGKWGEGKSSVINCVHSEIELKYPVNGPEIPPVVIHFNPWLFTNENQLLKNFFTTIAKTLRRRLKSNKQKIFELISTYAEAVGSALEVLEFLPVVNASGKVVKTTKGIASKLIDESLEQLKERIDQIIINSELNIVIFIDDIDRLDIRETQIIFKLVKLLGGFPRTSYVLAFDDELVAKSLASQYANSAHMLPGYTFLEKIIQIPLYLPKADQSSLHTFAFELIQNVHREINIQLTESEWAVFSSRFEMAFLPALSNPRIAILYANSIGFVIPLIGKEVNLLDLMILEAIKIFYPDIYHFIRSNPQYVLQKKEAGEKSKKIVSDFNNIIEKYSNSNIYLTYILQQVFPRLYINGTHGMDGDDDDWFRDKRICSSKYFDRYFTYSVQRGAISDVFFQAVMDKLFTLSIPNSIEYFRNVVSGLEASTFLYKLAIHLPSLSVEQVFHLGLVLRDVVNDFNDDENVNYYSNSDRIINQIALIIKFISPTKRAEYIVEILGNIQPLGAACQMIGSFLEKFQEVIFDRMEIENLSKVSYQQIILRYKQYLSNEGKLRELKNYAISQIFNAYYKMGHKDTVGGFVRAELAINPGFAVDIIKMCSRITYPPSQPDSYELQLLATTKESIEKLIPIDDLYSIVFFSYGDLASGVRMPLIKGSEYDYRAIAKFQKFYSGGCEVSD